MAFQSATLLRQAGLRVTAGRVAVLDDLERSPHSTAESIYRRVRTRLPSVSVQSVHNVVGALTLAGILGRIEPAGSAALYELRTGDNHHHIVCTSCGAVGDIDCVHGEAPCLTPADTGGYLVSKAEVVFWGLCASCQSTIHQPAHPQQGEK